MNKKGIIKLNKVSFRYSDESVLFGNITVELNQGDFHLVTGPSGAGKSTLLRLINRLEEPSEGEIFFRGKPVSEIPAPELRRSILYIQQTPVVTDGSIRKNLLLPFRFKNNRDLAVPDEKAMKKMLEEFSMGGVDLDKNARNLSVGQQQRLCLIRGTLLSPDVILLDEPTSALDDDSCKIVESYAESLCIDQGKTVIMVSHRAFKPQHAKFVQLEVKNKNLRLELK